MITPQLCFLVGRMVEPAVSGDIPHKTIRIAKRPEYNPTEFHEYALIVRCKDCIHMHHVFDHIWNIEVDECWLHASNETGALGKNRTETDGFCAWGKPREGSDK